MRAVRIWDYFMRRKILLFVMLGVIAILGAGCAKLGLGKTIEVTPEVPKTGETTEFRELGCDFKLLEESGPNRGGGVNDLTDEAVSTDMTFWGAEVPGAIINDTPADGAETETLIIVSGVSATIIVLIIAKFVFDHYVR